MTGMFFDNGRIYYTVSGNPRLYYRYFTPESHVVGANLFVASTAGPIDWANVRGMTMASGNLYYALSNGNLFRVPWVAGEASGTPDADRRAPAVDGVNWASRGLFAFSGRPTRPPPTAPGKPTGISSGFDSIDLTWSAAYDAEPALSPTGIYRTVARRRSPRSRARRPRTVSFTDTGLVAGSTHTYRVDADRPLRERRSDEPHLQPPSPWIPPRGAIFTDDFSSGSLTSWTGSTQFAIDGTIGAAPLRGASGSGDQPGGVPHARFQKRTLANSACTSLNIDATDGAPTARSLAAAREPARVPIRPWGRRTRPCARASGSLTTAGTGVALFRLRILDRWTDRQGPRQLGRDPVRQVGRVAGTSFAPAWLWAPGGIPSSSARPSGTATPRPCTADGTMIVNALTANTGLDTDRTDPDRGQRRSRRSPMNIDDVVVDQTARMTAGLEDRLRHSD